MATVFVSAGTASTCMSTKSAPTSVSFARSSSEIPRCTCAAIAAHCNLKSRRIMSFDATRKARNTPTIMSAAVGVICFLKVAPTPRGRPRRSASVAASQRDIITPECPAAAGSVSNHGRYSLS
eukprot:1717648-Prymnesium_polylepis.1